ncbi:MAG: hypothetical protein A3F90_18600 [Deltaproteobacteria bacterium RIFCSPLOWO2_12_FULL_60_19]|nr:MAG: hypothetical protein A3F90_18600 [Deltaproteobacteria bacterium RIFCSPLOWO2_12_FULL_60_19]
MTFVYETEIEWTGERAGRLRAPHLPPLEVSAPPEFDGREGAWTPEHLYVGAVASCFMTTFLAIARNSKLEFASFATTASGKLEKVPEAGLQMTEIVLKPRLVIHSIGDVDRARRIIEKAEKNCLISNSIKTAIRVTPEIYHHQDPVFPCPTLPA